MAFRTGRIECGGCDMSSMDRILSPFGYGIGNMECGEERYKIRGPLQELEDLLTEQAGYTRGVDPSTATFCGHHDNTHSNWVFKLNFTNFAHILRLLFKNTRHNIEKSD